MTPKRISAGGMAFRKRAFSTRAFNLHCARCAHDDCWGDAVAWLVLLTLPALVFGYWGHIKLLPSLVDEVKGDRIERIALSDIAEVRSRIFPSKVTLVLNRPSAFGNEIYFAGLEEVFAVTLSPVIEDLTTRVAAKRTS